MKGLFLLYDGKCGLCHRSVQFVLRHEREPCIVFVAQQSERGQRMLAEAGFPANPETMVFFENGVCRTEAEAALAIARHLRAPWRWFGCMRVLPGRWLQAAYRWVARRRLRWFGSRDVCEIPDPSQGGRFMT